MNMDIPNNYQPIPGLLQDRIILVTGAGAGIGREAAKTYAALQATVILLGKTKSNLEQVYDEIETEQHPQPAIFEFDLNSTDPNDYYRLGQTLHDTFGRLDGLLHNAAILSLMSRIDDYDPATWNKVMQVNLNAPFMLTQACLPLLRNSDDASVVFTTDRVGQEGKAYWGAYGVSKAGIESLMKIMANELEGSSIRVNAIDPGPVRSRIRALAYPGEDPRSLPSPELMMPVYAYLMGPDAKMVRGQTVTVSNGNNIN